MVAVINDDRAAYRVLATSGFFGPDDTLYAEGSAIYFAGEPNLEFEPLNKPAREAMTIYVQKLEVEGRKVAEKFGRSYLGIAKSLEDAIDTAQSDKRRVQLVEGDGGRPVMGARKQAGLVETIIDEEPPQDGRKSVLKRGPASIA